MVKIPAAWSAVAAYSALLALCADIRARRAVIDRIVAAAQMIRFSFCMVIHHLRGARIFHSVPLHIIERKDRNNCTIAGVPKENRVVGRLNPYLYNPGRKD